MLLQYDRTNMGQFVHKQKKISCKKTGIVKVRVDDDLFRRVLPYRYVYTHSKDYTTQQTNNKDQRKSIKVGHFLLQTTSSSVLFVAVLFILTTMEKYSLNSCGKLNF